MITLKRRKLLCLTTKEWAKHIAYVQIISCVFLLISTGLIILGLNSSANYSDEQLGSLAFPITMFMIIYCFQLVMGTVLYEGVMEENPVKLLAWIISIGCCFFLIISMSIIYLTTATNLPSSLSNMSKFTAAVLSFLIAIPSVISLVFVWVVNVYRLELLDQKIQGKQFIECLTNYFNYAD